MIVIVYKHLLLLHVPLFFPIQHEKLTSKNSANFKAEKYFFQILINEFSPIGTHLQNRTLSIIQVTDWQVVMELGFSDSEFLLLFQNRINQFLQTFATTTWFLADYSR